MPSVLTRIAVPKPKVERITVRFWLKPHLAQFARNFTHADQLDMVDTNVLGCIALSCLTPKAAQADRVQRDFRQGRVPLTGAYCMRSMERHGAVVQSYARFEDAVEHLFYHMLLVFVDAKVAEGIPQNDAIRHFLDQHRMDLDHIGFDTLKKTVIRRRKRLAQYRAKLPPTLSP